MIRYFLFTVLITCSQANSSKKEVKSQKARQLIAAAKERTAHKVEYIEDYVAIDYPMGDVPDSTGVCTDVIIRSYRKLGIDLQELVHLDMKKNFALYPSKRIWGLKKPDTNIDHRRVPNLQVFFKRFGKELPISNSPLDYKPGDIVTWNIQGGMNHIGIVIDEMDSKSGNPLIIHNMGAGTVKEDWLFLFKITGHYRYAIDEF